MAQYIYTYIRGGVILFLLLTAAAALIDLAGSARQLGAAQALSVGVPFGGGISLVRPCTKPPGTLITVGPPIPGEYIVLARGTTVFPFGSIRPEAYVLGVAGQSPLPCIAGIVPIGAGLPILIMGTSL